MEYVYDYSGDHKNTRDVSQIPPKLLLSMPPGVTDRRKTCLQVPETPLRLLTIS